MEKHTFGVWHVGWAEQIFLSQIAGHQGFDQRYKGTHDSAGHQF
jgi:hypothetical protein